jgi:hypothetical protein
MDGRWRRLSAALAAGAVAGSIGMAAARAGDLGLGGQPDAAPANTISRYMATASTTAHYDLGCDRAGRKVSGVVSLLYGMPVLVSGKYGASLFGGPDATTTKIAAAAKEFVRGFFECSSSGAFAFVAFSTSNYGSNVTYAHGEAWADMVSDISDYADANGYSSRVHVRAGSDMEPSWNGPTTTRAWIDGYASAYSEFVYNVGSADGCPQTGNGTVNGSCNNGWKQSDIYYVAWGSPPAIPLPEIYATSGANAKQWQKVKLYSVVTKGDPMVILGSLTQWNACQESGPCNGTDNEPDEGWQQLYDQLNSDSRTAQGLSYSTDISWEK